VSPSSDQLHFYAAGALETIEGLDDLPLDFPVVLTIWQPFVQHEPRRFETTVEGLAVWKASYETAINQSQRLAPPLALGSHCDYCPAKIVCPELRREVPSMLKLRPDLLSVEDLGRLASESAAATGLQDATFEEVKKALQGGVSVPSWKLVQGNRKRFWRDPENAAQALLTLGIEPYTRSLISVAEATRQLKEKGVDIHEVMRDHIEEGRNQPRVVPADAPGQSLADFSGFGRALGNIQSLR